MPRSPDSPVTWLWINAPRAPYLPISVRQRHSSRGSASCAGFIPDDAPDPAIIAGPLGSILGQLSTGGGAKGVNIEQVSGSYWRPLLE